MILAIDPGTTHSAYVRCAFGWESESPIDIRSMGILANPQMADYLRNLNADDRVVLEMVESFGMPVGKEVFQTVYWIGRMAESYEFNHATTVEFLTRKEVKITLCSTLRAKDCNVRQALIDLFPPTGGGRTPQIGTKANPGPLYGVKSHIWSALAVAVCFDTRDGSD